MDGTESVASGGIADAGASQSASPASTPESSSGSAAPAEQGTPNAGITDSTEREGFIPRSRFDEVNARMTKAEQFREQYGWAESVPREQLEQMSQWYAKYQGDPGEFLEQAYQEALSHPVHGATVKSRIARMMASMRQQTQAQEQQAPPEPIPNIPIVNGRNEPVGDLAEIVRRILDPEIAPIKQDYETRQTEKKTAAEKAEAKAKAEAQADADVAYVKSRPFFKDHKNAILKAFQENPQLSIREAADYVLDHQILPGFSQKAEATVLSNLQQKAAAQTVNPGTPSGTAQPNFKSFREAAEYYDSHPREAEEAARPR